MKNYTKKSLSHKQRFTKSSIGLYKNADMYEHLRCNVSPSLTNVSPTENFWMLHPLDKVSLGYFPPNQTFPSLNSDFLIAF